MEKWRDVPGFEGKYQIDISTKEGRCRSLSYNKTGKTRILSNKPGKDGRIYWNLWKNNVCTHYQAARWIALTYPELVENEYFEGAQIDHKDTIRLNNHPSNLRWVTPKENTNNPITLNNKSKARKGVPMSEEQKIKISQTRKRKHSGTKPVIQYDLDWSLIKRYQSEELAEKETGVLSENISACCLGKQKTAKGYRFKFE